MLPVALEYPPGDWNGFRVYRPARGGRSCERFGGCKTINQIPLPFSKRYHRLSHKLSMFWPYSPYRLSPKHGPFKHAFWVSNVNGFDWDLAWVKLRVFQREGCHISSILTLFKVWRMQFVFVIFSKSSNRIGYNIWMEKTLKSCDALPLYTSLIHFYVI